jgi:AraC family transcriptional activator of pobA
MALVERHFASPQPLDFYAGQLGVTPDHLSRSCRLVSRKSALQMLQDRRMLEARRLLAYTPMPVVEVAVQIGFDDPAYFSRSFRREVGQSPSEYRTLVASGVRGSEPAGA